MESNASALLALAAGFVSFVSPCVLPLVPSYMVFITGLSFDQLEHENKAMRRVAAFHAAAFVLGFSLIFILLGASATALGSLVFQYSGILMRVGGVVVLLFGFYLLGLLKWGALEQEKRIHLANKPHGYLGTVVVGMTFALGWTPCIGPILGSILLLASSTGSVATGIYLLGAYALGLGIPFLLAGIAFPWFIGRMRKASRFLGYVTKASGVMLVALGLLMITNTFPQFTGWFGRILPTIELEQYLTE